MDRNTIKSTAEAQSGRWRVWLVDDEPDLLALREPWQVLLAADGSASFFLSWEWITTWWKHRSPGAELWVLAAADADGHIAGIAPLMRLTEGRGPFCIRRLAFIGTGLAYPAHLDVIALPQDRPAVASAFQDYLELHRDQWDVLELFGLADVSCLGQNPQGRRGRWWERTPLISPYVSLPDSWEVYERDGIPGTHRQQVRSRRRRIERDFPGEVTYELVKEPGDLEGALSTLVSLSERRWDSKGIISSLSDRTFRAFLRDVTATAMECGWLRFYVLRVAGEPIAAHCSFRFGHIVYGYQTGFALDWRYYRPGQLMQAHVIQEAITEGAKEFDLLNGAHEYKFFWTDQVRTDHHRLWTHSLRGHLWASAIVLFERAKRIGRQKLPQSLQTRIELWLHAFLSRRRPD